MGLTPNDASTTFDQVNLSLKTVGSLSVVSRNMLMQSTPDIEMLVRADLVASIALAIDAAALYGAGTGGVPLGITNQVGVGSVVGGTNGGAVTINNLIDMETQVMSANTPDNNLAYMMNARTVGALKKLVSTTGQYLWTNYAGGQRSGTPGEINGYTVARSNQCRSTLTKGTGTNLSELFFGNWAEVMIGEWGVLELQPNPYAASVAAAGGVELRALQSIDVGVRHATSFAVMSDAIA
ncbi:MAG: phage major capsid protein [Burkholderiales bacterium]|nr:phage major capsid protein [Burkholderiales bacterium]